MLLSTSTTHAQTLALSPADKNIDSPVVIEGPALALPPVTLPPPVTAPVNPPPVEAAKLNDIKPDSIGTIASGEGGLGADLWKGTSRLTVEHFLPMLTLPASLATMNALAERLLLTTAAAPDGQAGTSGQSLTALRVDKLVALGHAADAWKLATLAPADQIDDLTLRQAAEATLATSFAPDVCAKLSFLMETHKAIEWQKLMVVCQLIGKDNKAAQVSLDLLHAQDIHDDSFFALAEKNVMADNKQLPRQLTPLKPLNLALLHLLDLPLRSEVYAHPDATLIPELLATKAIDDTARLALAERAAARGVIAASTLVDVYRSAAIPREKLSDANISSDSGPMLRALLYQASQQEHIPQNRAAEAIKFLDSLNEVNGAGGAFFPLIVSMLGDMLPTPELNDKSAAIARIYLLAGNLPSAMAWLEQAHNAARGIPQVAADLRQMWPLTILSGVDVGADFNKGQNAWLATMLHGADASDISNRIQKNAAASILVLLESVNAPVSDEAWATVVDSVLYEKAAMPPPFVMEHMRAAAAANRKGETLLMALLAATGGKDDPPVLVTADIVRSLRMIGLKDEAAALAKEAALRVMYMAAK